MVGDLFVALEGVPGETLVGVHIAKGEMDLDLFGIDVEDLL